MKYIISVVFLFSLLNGCGPSEEERNQATLDVYSTHKTQIKAKRKAMVTAFSPMDNLSPREVEKPFDLKNKPAIDITTYPQNGFLALCTEDIDAKFIRVES